MLCWYYNGEMHILLFIRRWSEQKILIDLWVILVDLFYQIERNSQINMESLESLSIFQDVLRLKAH